MGRTVLEESQEILQSSVISKSKSFIFQKILKMSKNTFICICVLCVHIF